MTEINDLFDYGLKIYQNRDFFKFSLDSILLAEFVNLKNVESILDMCTGNAPVPLILHTKKPTVEIDAVEIQEEVFNLADHSIKENGLTDKIKIYNSDIKTINLNKKYDVVTCNPPYFRVNNKTLQNENEVKRIARHEIKVTLEDVIKIAKKHIKENGTFYLVHRTDRLLETIDTLHKYNFGLRKMALILTKTDGYAEFFIIEASNYKKDDLKVVVKDVSNFKSYKGVFEE